MLGLMQLNRLVVVGKFFRGEAMKKLLLVVLAAILISCGIASANASPWPMLSHDPQNTGYTTFNGTKQADVYWKFSVCSAVIWDHHQAIVGDDGGLFTLYPNGTLKSRGFRECNVATLQ